MTVTTIEVGRDPAARFYAFGDDSAYGEVLVYAFVIVPKRRARVLRRRLGDIKKKFGFPLGAKLHCRELLGEHARQKAGLGHLSHDDARAVLAHVVTELNDLVCQVRYGFFRVPADGRFYPDFESDVIQPPLKDDPKAIQASLASFCFLTAQDGSQGPHVSDCEVVAAEDSTLAHTFGGKRRRADSLVPSYLDFGMDPNQILYLNPHVLPQGAEPLLEVADVVAYICAHALSAENKYPFWGQQLERIKYRFWSEYGPAPWVG